jgi:hypothetical protein
MAIDAPDPLRPIQEWIIEDTKKEITDLLRDHSSREVQRILAERDEGKIVIMCPVTRRMCRNNTCAWTAACRFQQLEEGRLIMAITTHGPAFQAWKNFLFGTPAAMASSAAIATQGVPRELFLFDTFLKRVVPHRALWPQGETPTGRLVSSYDTHKRNVDRLRADLVDQPNTEAVAPDEVAVPKYRLDLLDLAIQKCFYSEPPIPIETDRQDAKNSKFAVRLVWETDLGGFAEDGRPLNPAMGRPLKLFLTIYCPDQHTDTTRIRADSAI